MEATTKYNMRNPAVKRILQEMKEMQREPSTEFVAEALETDLFEWIFAIRGPPDTEFEGGIYIGRIILPPEYPFKPPSFVMLTPNGRFETGTKICLSISSHHPEHWQPSWSVRTALTALVAFMPTPGNGAIGSLDSTPEDRRLLAAESCIKVPTHGAAERCQLIKRLHEELLARAARQQQQKQNGVEEAAAGEEAPKTDFTPPAAAQAGSAPHNELEAAAQAPAPSVAAPAEAVHATAPAARVATAIPPVPSIIAPAYQLPLPQQEQQQELSGEERLLTLAAGAILAIILAILAKKVVFGHDVLGMGGGPSAAM